MNSTKKLRKGQIVACTFYGGLWKVVSIVESDRIGQTVNIRSKLTGILINVRIKDVFEKTHPRFLDYVAQIEVM